MIDAGDVDMKDSAGVWIDPRDVHGFRGVRGRQSNGSIAVLKIGVPDQGFKFTLNLVVRA